MKVGQFAAAVCATVAISSPQASVAQTAPPEFQGAALKRACEQKEAWCGAYLQGVADVLVGTKVICDPPQYDREQLRVASLRWAAGEQYLLNRHMIAGAEAALRAAWPCKPS